MVICSELGGFFRRLKQGAREEPKPGRDSDRPAIGEKKMKMVRIAPLAAIAVTLLLVGCGNTIRGMGQDTANAVDATQDAGRKVERAAR